MPNISSKADVKLPEGSESMSKTFAPYAASLHPNAYVEVVFPTPPLPVIIVLTLAGLGNENFL